MSKKTKIIISVISISVVIMIILSVLCASNHCSHNFCDCESSDIAQACLECGEWFPIEENIEILKRECKSVSCDDFFEEENEKKSIQITGKVIGIETYVDSSEYYVYTVMDSSGAIDIKMYKEFAHDTYVKDTKEIKTGDTVTFYMDDDWYLSYSGEIRTANYAEVQ